MSATAAMMAGRAAIENLMEDTCRITREGAGNPVPNETTGQYEYPDRVAVYEGPCRFQRGGISNFASVYSVAGERNATVQGDEVQLPMSTSDGVRLGDVVECLTSIDPDLVERKFTVTALHHKTHTTSRRLRVQEVTG